MSIHHSYETVAIHCTAVAIASWNESPQCEHVGTGRCQMSEGQM